MSAMLNEEELQKRLQKAADAIASARHLTAFTGAGISVESGIPPVRGPGGVWEKYDPDILDLDVFIRHPDRSWPAVLSALRANAVLALHPLDAPA